MNWVNKALTLNWRLFRLAYRLLLCGIVSAGQVACASPAERVCVVNGLGADVSLHSQAGAEGDAIGTVPDGAEVEWFQQTNTRHGDVWLRVGHGDSSGWLPGEAIRCYLSPDGARKAVAGKAGDALIAIRDRNFDLLGNLVHPTKGVRFSPHAYVDSEDDLVFSADEIRHLAKSQDKRTWGYEAGSGDRIELSFADYHQRFIYDKDYMTAEKKGFNEFFGSTNSPNNLFDVYPDAAVAEFHYPGVDPKRYGADWSSLRLVFEQHEGVWYLVGVVHAQWGI